MNLVFVFIVLLGLTATVCSQSVCTTPSGESGKCIGIRKCEVIYNALRNEDPAIRKFLIESACGYEGKYPLVCCGTSVGYASPQNQSNSSVTRTRIRSVSILESFCRTPGREIGRCVPIRSCGVILKALGTQDPEVKKFLTESYCGYEGKYPRVCCGSTVGYRPTVNRTIASDDPTQSLNASNCKTPDGKTGRCIPIRKCELIYNSVKTQDPVIKKYLQDSYCGYEDKSPRVCCDATENIQVPVNESSKPDDPTRHRNAELVPPKGRCGKQGILNKIYGGNETDINEFPWMALLGYRRGNSDTRMACGGVLISERYVLTAAHCVKGTLLSSVGKLYDVRLGEYDLRTDKDCVVIFGEGDDDPDVTVCADEHQNILVEEIIAHEQYDPRERIHDIALVRLAKKATLNGYVQPICLPLNGESSSPGHNLTVAGWGQTENAPSSSVKLKVDLPLVSQAVCSQAYVQYKQRITTNQLCAGGAEGTDSCRGDSGGPIMRTFDDRPDYYLEGVVSYGPTECGTFGIPGVYTKVSQYINWIMDNLKP